MEWGVVAGFAVFIAFGVFAFYIFPFKIIPLIARAQVKFTRKMLKEHYTQEVPGFGTRCRDCPFTMEEVAALLDDLVDEWDLEHEKFERPAIKEKIDGLMIWFVPADPKVAEETGGGANRHIKDAYGRIIAGDHQGDEVRVVFNEDDVARDEGTRVGPIALAHECAHELDELLGIIDYDHRPEIYSGKGVVGRVKRKHS